MTFKIIVGIIGFVLIFVGIWGGAWLCSQFPLGESIYDFSAALTGFIVTWVGVYIAVYAVVKS